jgi:pre-rRNA-processing protein TSR3
MNKASSGPVIPCRLTMFDYEQCDPKRCSGRKLYRHGLIAIQKVGTRFPGILLTASASKSLSPADRQLILQKGLAVIDCSWNQIESTSLHRVKVHQDYPSPKGFNKLTSG